MKLIVLGSCMGQDAHQSLNRTLIICPRGKRFLDSSTSVSLRFRKISGISKYCCFFHTWCKMYRKTNFIADESLIMW